MLYNADVTIWQNYRDHLLEMPNGGARILVTKDGSIHNGMAVLARCASEAAAKSLLRAAGFSQRDGYFKAA